MKELLIAPFRVVQHVLYILEKTGSNLKFKNEFGMELKF